MSSYKKVTTNNKCDSPSGKHFTGKLIGLGGRGFSHTAMQHSRNNSPLENHIKKHSHFSDLHPGRNPQTSANYPMKVLKQQPVMKATKDSSWSEIPEELPQFNSNSAESLPAKEPCESSIEDSFEPEVLPESESYPSSYENNISETHALLGETDISDVESRKYIIPSNQISNLVLQSPLKTKGLVLEPFEEDKKSNGIVKCQVDMNEALLQRQVCETVQ